MHLGPAKQVQAISSNFRNCRQFPANFRQFCQKFPEIAGPSPPPDLKGLRHIQTWLWHFTHSRFIPPDQLSLGSHPPSTEPKTPKTQKVSKKSPERSLGPPTRDPEKVTKKSEKSRKSLKINYFLDFSDFFGTFWGFLGRGVPNSSRETFLRLFGFSGFWVL